MRALEAASADGDGVAQRCAALLGAMAPVERTWAGPAFRCPPGLAPAAGIVVIGARDATLLEPDLPGWLPNVGRIQPLVALLARGRVVALCGSGRRTPCAHEAALETAPAHRGRGAAGVVVAAWAHAVRALGAEALYSTAWENRASLAVARKLAPEPIGSDLHPT